MNASQRKRPRPASRIGIQERRTAAGVEQFRGSCFDKGTGKQLRGPWTTSLAEARSWRVDAMARIQAGTLSGNRGRTLKEAADDYIAGARAGTILNRGREEYKPSAVRSLETAFRIRVIPTLGANTRVGDIKRAQVQKATDRWAGDHLSPSAVRNTLNALKALCRYLERRGEITVNPTSNIDAPRVKGGRDRVASPSEGLALLTALGARERPIYGTAMFAGLRLGELRALRCKDVDLDRLLIYVRRAWDPVEGPIAPKSDAGVRDIPIVKALAGILVAHLRTCEWSQDPDALVFGNSPTAPFVAQDTRNRATKRWAAAKLDPIGLHEGRHTAASWFIAAGVNLKAISTFLGHSSINVTLDKYGHLLPGDEAAAGDLVNAYLARSAKAA